MKLSTVFICGLALHRQVSAAPKVFSQVVCSRDHCDGSTSSQDDVSVAAHMHTESQVPSPHRLRSAAGGVRGKGDDAAGSGSDSDKSDAVAVDSTSGGTSDGREPLAGTTDSDQDPRDVFSNLGILESGLPNRLDSDGYPLSMPDNQWRNDVDEQALNTWQRQAEEPEYTTNEVQKSQPDELRDRAARIDRSFANRDTVPRMDSTVSKAKADQYYVFVVKRDLRDDDYDDEKYINVFRSAGIPTEKIVHVQVHSRDEDGKKTLAITSEFYGDSDGKLLVWRESWAGYDENAYRPDGEGLLQKTDANTRQERYLQQSELAWHSLQKIAPGKQLRAVYISNAVNAVTLAASLRTAKGSNRASNVDGFYMRDGTRQGESDGFKEMAGTPNIQSVGWLLSDHVNELNAIIRSVTTRWRARQYKNKDGGVEGPANIELDLVLKLSPYRN